MDILKNIKDLNLKLESNDNFEEVLGLISKAIIDTSGIGDKTIAKIQVNIKEELIQFKDKNKAKKELETMKKIEGNINKNSFNDKFKTLFDNFKNELMGKIFVVDCKNTKKLNLLVNIIIQLNTLDNIKVRFEFNDPMRGDFISMEGSRDKKYIWVEYDDSSNTIYFFYVLYDFNYIMDEVNFNNNISNNKESINSEAINKSLIVDIDTFTKSIKKTYNINNFNDTSKPNEYYNREIIGR